MNNTARAWDNVSSSAQSLRSHPLRSALTMLGMVIGIASVITVMAVGAGSRAEIIAQIQSLGGNLLLVTPGSAQSKGVRLGGGTRPTLSESDAEAMRREIPGLLAVAPSVYKRAQVIRGNLNWSTTVQGITQEYLIAREWKLSSGRHLSTADLASAAKVALLGATVSAKLFPQGGAEDAFVRIGSTPFTVIGTLESKGQTSLGSDQDDKVMIPLSTAKIRVIGSSRRRLTWVQYIMVKVRNAELLDRAEEEIRKLLRQRHRLAATAEDDFTIRNLAELQASRKAAAGVLSLWLTVVASISLLVGGISIMNIMLVSVSERTTEIGLRLAVGARRRDIRNQFLAEALILSLLGAAVGLLLGVLLALAIGAWGDLTIIFEPRALILAVGFAVLTGVCFGLFPATKASRLTPIESLRRE